ncbi:nitrogenase component 1 [Methanothermobacter sp.]|uniref:nitrogenase component 1 n=1 Tax=Methanothermobacter sp. TaxID=1884223 RepID=UPI00260FD9F0|nr:nitrogenase component 1 [Methanothermobacter sp.]MDI9614630.1 nitrogenase component 1 [Methanothermobacter sp.]
MEHRSTIMNPGTICQPLGAVMAFLGIRGSMPLIHGSQGCSTYMRFQLTRHFREPVNIASSSLSEATVVYGGEENLLRALKTVEEQYSPEVIGVISGCLSETIGDDIDRIVDKHRGRGESEIITVSSPGFRGSHVDGYEAAVKSILRSLVRGHAEPVDRINIINGIMSPADTSEIKNILEGIGVDFLMITDNSESLDEPFDGDPYFITRHGTSIHEIAGAGSSMATLNLGGYGGGEFLEKKYGVKNIELQIPAGLGGTDKFLGVLLDLFHSDISRSIRRERGRLMDAMIDSHQYTSGRRVAIFADPAYAVALTSLVLEMGMQPYVFTGSRSRYFHEKISQLQSKWGSRFLARSGVDIFGLRENLAGREIDVLIGNSHCARVARELGVPLMRIGFPVYDRVGSQRIRIAGYAGGIAFVDSLTNLILESHYDEGYEIEGDTCDKDSCCVG